MRELGDVMRTENIREFIEKEIDKVRCKCDENGNCDCDETKM